MTDPDCIFCSIATGDLKANVAHRSERLVAFGDVDPQAPVHLLIIPVEHIPSLNDLQDGHRALLGEMHLLARDLASDRGLDASGWRLVTNCGRGAGQSVFHIHMHLLGGRPLSWPPG